MVIAASVGAVIGDSISYELGRRFGQRLGATRLGRRVGEPNWSRAREYVGRRGGRAVFFGRFLGVLRALVPAVAGWAGMRYRSFLTFNVAGGLLWATGTILLGVAAGSSWHIVEAWVGRAGWLGTGLVAAAVLVVATRLIKRQQRSATS